MSCPEPPRYPAAPPNPSTPRSQMLHTTTPAATPSIMTDAQHLLIDVRSPAEFATGPLTSDIAPTINIEYTLISQLSSIYAAHGITVHKDADITLYCRSGRRSNIALQTLKNMGYVHVRDIGGLEEARGVLDREQVGRQLEGEMEAAGLGAKGREDEAGIQAKGGREDPKKHVRVKSFGVLVEGLKALEE
jgi:rhodanese-related sulfurtransferase